MVFLGSVGKVEVPPQCFILIVFSLGHLPTLDLVHLSTMMFSVSVLALLWAMWASCLEEPDKAATMLHHPHAFSYNLFCYNKLFLTL